MILGVGGPIKLEDTPEQQKRKGGGKAENEIQTKTTAERTIGAFRNKGQAIVCSRITRREFS
jgi:hypothetical protein